MVEIRNHEKGGVLLQKNQIGDSVGAAAEQDFQGYEFRDEMDSIALAAAAEDGGASTAIGFSSAANISSDPKSTPVIVRNSGEEARVHGQQSSERRRNDIGGMVSHGQCAGRRRIG